MADNHQVVQLENVQIGDGDDLVTPWDVQCSSAKGVDYDKLTSEWKIFNILYHSSTEKCLPLILHYWLYCQTEPY